MRNLIFLILLIFLISSCKDSIDTIITSDEKTEGKISLSVTRFSCTEAWLDFQLPQGGREFKIWVDSLSLTLAPVADTTLFIENLLPAKNYTISVIAEESEEYLADSLHYNFQTLDTTSHEFNYELIEIGEGTYNLLRDVTIFDDASVLAVGSFEYFDIRVDSALQRYNGIIWEGGSWEPKRIKYRGNCSVVEYPELFSVFALGANEYAITNGSSCGIFTENILEINCDVNDLITGTIFKIAGISSNHLYTIGQAGQIITVVNGVSSSINSGVEYDLIDIFINGETILICGNSLSTGSGSILIMNTGSNSVEKLIEFGVIEKSELFNKLDGLTSSIWVDENKSIYCGGSYLYVKNDHGWVFERHLENNDYRNSNLFRERGYIFGVRGNASNDYVIVGEKNTIEHFNGISWKHIGIPKSLGEGYTWNSVSMKDDIIAVIGRKGLKVAMLILSRS